MRYYLVTMETNGKEDKPLSQRPLLFSSSLCVYLFGHLCLSLSQWIKD